MEEQPEIKPEALNKARVSNKLETLQKMNNYPGLEKLVKLAKEKHPEIIRTQIKTFLNEDTSRQLTKVQHDKSSPGHVVAMVPDELWLMDTFDLSKYMKQNKDHRYIYYVVLMYSPGRLMLNPCCIKTLQQSQKHLLG